MELHNIYIVIMAVLLSGSFYISYLTATIINKVSNVFRHEETFMDEMDKTIDANIKRIAALEYELKKLKSGEVAPTIDILPTKKKK